MPGLLTPEKFEKWSQALRPDLVKLADRQCGPDAESVAQDAITSGLLNLQMFDADDGFAGFEAWLKLRLKWRISDWRRDRGRFVQRSDEQLEDDRWNAYLNDNPDPDLAEEASMRLRHVKLTFNQRRCLITLIDGIKLKEAAELFDMSISNVYYHRCQAIKALQAVDLASAEWHGANHLPPHKWKGQKVYVYHKPTSTGAGLARLDVRLGKCSVERPMTI